nr:hypothetical protein [Candidatus Sigynarchaeota archaeon]
MRQKLKRIIVTIWVIAITIPAGVLGGFIFEHVKAWYDYQNTANTTYNQLTPASEFWPANFTFLSLKARGYDYRIHEYHTPDGMVLNARFTGTDVLTVAGGPTMDGYSAFGDSPHWTGHLLAAEGFRYAASVADGDTEQANAAVGNITRILDAIDRITHVTGIPGQLVRYAWIDDPGGLNRSRGCPWNGTFNGTPYVYDADTSRDQHSGVLLGLGVTAELVSPTQLTIAATVKRIVEDMIDFQLMTDWRYMEPDNRTIGTDFRPGWDVASTDGAWQLAFLQIGRLVNPAKYGPLYLHLVNDLNQIERIYNTQEVPSNLNLRTDYYGSCIMWAILYSSFRYESDPATRVRLDQIMRETIWPQFRHHRNAYFNMIYLGCRMETNESGAIEIFTPEEQYIINDTLDALMRIGSDPKCRDGLGRSCIKAYVPSGVYYVYPDNTTATPGMYNGTTNQLLYRLDPLYYETQAAFQDISGLVGGFFNIEPVSDHVTPANLRPGEGYLWEGTPYRLYPYFGGDDLSYCYPGVDFWLPYWMGRYYNFWEAA